MSRIFISHSSEDNDKAIALRDWLWENGWDDVFLDVAKEDGIPPGELWKRALVTAIYRCEAVLFLVSRVGLASDYCQFELSMASILEKPLFGVLIEDIPRSGLPAELTARQAISLVPSGHDDNTERRAKLPRKQDEVLVNLSKDGLHDLRIALELAGLDARFRFFAWPPANDLGRSPYRGLLPLEADDAGIFFGRDAPMAEALDRIRDIKDADPPRLLVVLGASGAGKSSFLRAGLLPRLARDDRNYLPLGVVRPNGPPGETLLQSLEAVFETYRLDKPRADIREAIAGGAKTLRPLLRELAAQALKFLTADNPETKPPTLVLAIDQGEEFFLTESFEESGQLFALLQELTAADDPALLVLITIRSDAFGQLQNTPLLEKVSPEMQSLPPMPLTNYRDVIKNPAARRHPKPLEIEPRLIEALLSDIGQDGGRDALPLLAFTLERLYNEYGKAQDCLKLETYEKLGRIEGSIKAAIDAAIKDVFKAADNDSNIPRDPTKRLELIRRGMIPWLATIDPDTGAPRRRRARRSDIPDEALPLIDLLVDQRLLSKDAEQQPVDPKTGEVSPQIGEPMIEVAHESLLRLWDKLKAWLEEDSAALINLEVVKRAARDWVASKHSNSDDLLIHRTGRLKEARELLQRRYFKELLGTTGCEYLDACKRREEEQLRREEQRQQEISRQRDELQHSQATGLSWQARIELQSGNLERALRFAVLGTKIDLGLPGNIFASSPAATSLLAIMVQEGWWRLILSGHGESVNSAAFSPDGTRVVTASADGTARIWDADTGKEINILEGHEDWVHLAAFSPDGARVITASDDNTARIWDADTGEELNILEGHKYPVNSAAFSPDGAHIVTASGDSTAHIWDADMGKGIKVLEGHNDEVNSAAYSPDGTRVITASDDNTARIWDADTGEEVKTLKGHTGWVRSAAFSPDGTRVVTASRDNTARIWDADTGKEIKVLKGHKDGVNSAAFSPDGARVVTVSDDKNARIWEAATGKEVKILEGHKDTVRSAVFSPDGTCVVTASWDKTARIWDADTGEEVNILEGHKKLVNSAAFSPDGTRFVTASYDNTARIWKADTGDEVKVLEGHKKSVTSAAFSPDGTRIVTASWDSTARIWDADTGNEVKVLEGHKDWGTSAAFSPDGTRIVTASIDRTARLWDANTGKEVKVLEGHKGWVESAAFSPDGTRVVTASNDKTARIWDAGTGEEIKVLVGHRNTVSSAAFNPDGTRVVTASDDSTVRIWDADTGKEIKVLVGHTDTVSSAAFSPNGTHVATASKDKTARIWDVHFAVMPTKSLLAKACLRLLGFSKLSREEMLLLGYPDTQPEINVCEGIW